jgi:glycosyltransferase involved in cell wall biosynthesis
MKILNVFNCHVERGGEAIAVDAICDSLSHIAELERCDFSSVDWLKPDAPARWKQAIRMIRNPESLAKLRGLQIRFQPDFWLLHNVFPIGSAAIYPEARQLGVPIIQYIHNFRPFSVSGYLWAGNRLAPEGLVKNFWPEVRAGAWQNSRAKTAWLALILLGAHGAGWWRIPKTWIAISDFMRDKFVSAGIPAKSIFTLRHFWTPKQPPPSHEGTHFLFLGRLTEAKGINVLLEAWQILEQRYGTSAPRLLIGGDGPLRSDVAAKVERMKCVTFAGELSGAAKQQAFDQARAIIAPSISWEALGLVVYEAYDYYRPVLVARSGGLPEVVVEPETGLIHEPGNAEQLVEHVLELQKDSRRAEEMGRRGRAWLEAHANESDWQSHFSAIAESALKANSLP